MCNSIGQQRQRTFLSHLPKKNNLNYKLSNQNNLPAPKVGSQRNYRFVGEIQLFINRRCLTAPPGGADSMEFISWTKPNQLKPVWDATWKKLCFQPTFLPYPYNIKCMSANFPGSGKTCFQQGSPHSLQLNEMLNSANRRGVLSDN